MNGLQRMPHGARAVRDLRQRGLMAHVLVVDDDTSMLHAMKALLTGDGHTVECASSGAEAMALLREQRFDAVVTDLEMRPPDGADVARAARRAQPWTCIYICTASALLERARAADPCFLMSKPFDYEVIHGGIVACRSCESCEHANRCHGRLHR